MKTMILAAAAALSLSAGAAYAQGVPAGGDFHAPVYGSQAFSDHPDENHTVFLGKGTVFGRIFGHSENSQVTADKTAGQTVGAVKGS